MAELQEQLRDVMFYIDAKQKLQATDEVTQQEIEDSQIVVQPGPQATAGSKKPRKKGR